MHDHDSYFPVRHEIAARAHVNADGYRALYAEADARPGRRSGREHASASPGCSRPPGPARRLRRATCGHLVRGRHAERLRLAASTATSPTRGDQVAIIWEGDDPAARRSVTYRRAARAGLPARQCAEGLGVKQGRPGLHLPADGGGGGGRHAGLRPHRRRPHGGVRRLLARQPGAAHPGRRGAGADHRRRGPPRRAQGGAEGQRRRRGGSSARRSSTCWWSRSPAPRSR